MPQLLGYYALMAGETPVNPVVPIGGQLAGFAGEGVPCSERESLGTKLESPPLAGSLEIDLQR